MVGILGRTGTYHNIKMRLKSCFRIFSLEGSRREVQPR